MKNLKKNKGFTLVEIMIVVMIIAILAALLVPALGGAIVKANASSVLQAANRYMGAAQVVLTEKYIKEGYTNNRIELKPTDILNFLGKSSLEGGSDIIANSVKIDSKTGGSLNEFWYKDDKRKMVCVMDPSTGTLYVFDAEDAGSYADGPPLISGPSLPTVDKDNALNADN